MPKYIAVIENWGDFANYADWWSNFSFEANPLEMIGNIINSDTKRTLWVSSVEDMVNKILTAAGGSQIWWLVILGHGTSGWQSIGCGQNLDPTDTKHLYVEGNTGKLAGDAENQLKRLRSVITQNTVVSLMGCKTGDGTKGELLLKAVSNALGGAKVEAGMVDQLLFPGFEGAVRSCVGNSCVIKPCSKLEDSALKNAERFRNWVNS